MRRLWFVGMGLLVCAGCIVDETGPVETTVYGRLKADVSYDSAATNSNGNFVQWVDDAASEDDQLAVTARETRVGVKLKQGESVSGLIEFDLYGGTTENKPTVLLRKVYAKMELAEGISLLAGQTGDVFSPLLPAVLNYGWGWNCGNTGYRRPQVRLEYANSGLVAQAALARAIDGEVSGNPDVQARVGYGLKNDSMNVAVGVSIVKGTRDTMHDDVVDGLAVDFHTGFGPLVLRGEYFTGENLSSYLGGIGQGLNDNGEEINTAGMWFQVGYKVTDQLTINGGYLFDDPDEDDLTGAADVDDRDKNTAWFVNVRGKLNKNTEAGIEVSGWTTTYTDGTDTTDYENMRYQASLIYTF